MNENQVWKLEDCEDQALMNENQVWKQEDWEEPNLDEWNINFDVQKIVKARLGWLRDQI